MIKKFGVWYTIKYYNFIAYAVSAVILFFFSDLLFEVICTITELAQKNAQLYNLTRFAVPIVLWAFWGALLFTTVRSKRYFFLTGRKFGYDNNHYKRTYSELVDYFQYAEPHKLDTSKFPEQTWREVKGLIFGMDGKRIVSIPSNSECNIAVFGPPGSGKTSGFAIINAMQFQGSVLAIDIKGDIYNYVHANTNRQIIRFAPDHPDALEISCTFDPLSGFTDMSVTDQKLYLENMATVLIADEGGNEGNYFTSRARKIFQGITHLILFETPNASFPDIIHGILQGNVFDWVTKAIDSDCDEAKELLASFYGNNEKNVSGAYDALTSALVHFSNPILDQLLSKGSNCISIDTLEKGFDVYLQIAQEHLDAYAPLFTLIMQSFSTAFMQRDDCSTGAKNRPILMLMDEFPQLTYSYKMANSNFSLLRAKGVIALAIQQGLSQLEYRYQPAGARSIIGNCNYQVILGSNDISSSEVFSKTFGMKKILKVSNSVTQSGKSPSVRSVQETETRVFPPEYFGDLSSKSKMILYCKGKYAELQKLNCYKDL